jgi:tripartite motif-containing protein 71
VVRSLAATLAALACFVSASPASAEVGFLRAFGEEGRGAGQFALPDGIGVDDAGTIWVADSQNNRIQRFTTDGRPVRFDPFRRQSRSTAPGRFDLPYDVDVDALGNLYVADTQNHRIQVFTPEGRFVRMWGRNGGSGEPGVAPGEFDQPRGLTLDSFGNVWVADHENARVQKFSPDGRLQLVLGKNGGDGSFGDGVGEFNSPRGLCNDFEGNVYVADDANHRIVKLASDGTWLAVFGKPGGPVSGFGTGPGEFKLPYGCAVDRQGHLWVADTSNNRVVELTTGGTFVRNWGANTGDGTPGAGPGEFEEPYNAGSDCAGNVYVSDEHNHRVQVFGDRSAHRPVCPPQLTVGGRRASLRAREISFTAECSRLCRVRGNASGRADNGTRVRLRSRPVVLGPGASSRISIPIPRRIAARLERGDSLTLVVVASGPPAAADLDRRSVRLR